MLIFWTSAKQDAIGRTVGVALNRLPKKPPHRFIEYQEGQLDVPSVAPGEVLLAMGSGPLKALQTRGYFPKNRGIKSLSGRVAQPGVEFGSYMVTTSPDAIGGDDGVRHDIIWAVTLADRVLRTGQLSAEIGQYRWVEDFTEMVQQVEARHAATGRPVDLALDLETQGFYPWYADKKIVTVQLSVEEGTADVLWAFDGIPQTVCNQLHWLLTTEKVSLRGANLKFDILWLWEKLGIRPTNFRFDTLLVGSLLDENRSNSLSNHVKEYAPTLGGYDDESMHGIDKGQIEKAPKDQLLIYAGGDADGTLRVANVMKRDLLSDPVLANFYVKLLHPAARLFEKIERRGLEVDVGRFQQLEVKLEAEIKAQTERVFSMMPRRLKLKYSDNLSLGRPALLKDLFFSPMGFNLTPQMTTAKSDEPSTAKAHLSMFADHPDAGPVIAAMAELNSAQKMLSTYVHGFLAHLRPDGRFHPTYWLGKGFEHAGQDDGGTDTGRLSATDPAVQTIPKKNVWAKAIRRCFPASPGCIFFEVDFDQGELRVVACVAPERRMLDAFKNGMDLHSITAGKLNGMEYDEFKALEKQDKDKYKSLRTGAKAGNFGLLYLMQPAGFVAYAWQTYGVALTLEEATEFHYVFLNELYPDLPKYHERMINMARRWKMVRNPLGRIRHLPTIDSWTGAP